MQRLVKKSLYIFEATAREEVGAGDGNTADHHNKIISGSLVGFPDKTFAQGKKKSGSTQYYFSTN